MKFQPLEKAGPGLPRDASKGKPLGSLLALLVIPLFLGLLIGPQVYNPLRQLSRHTETFDSLQPVKFEKVTQRCVMLVALALLFPLVRRSGLGPQIKRALALDAQNRRELARAYLVGCASMAGIYAGGLAIGAYQPEAYLSAGPAITKSLSFLVGAVFIGFFEETFFRGVVFGALRVRVRFWPAAFAASLFFAGLHFVTADYPGRVRDAMWHQGFLLLPHLFEGFAWARDWRFFCTLFLMGLTLCVIYERRGHLAWCIGLHGGWVLAMQLGNYFLGRDREYLDWWFSRSDYIAKAPVAIPIILIFFIWSLTLKKSGPGSASSSSNTYT